MVNYIYLIFLFVTQTFKGSIISKDVQRLPKVSEEKSEHFQLHFPRYIHMVKSDTARSYAYRKQNPPRFYQRSIELKQHRRSEILSMRPWRFDSLTTLTEGSWVCVAWGAQSRGLIKPGLGRSYWRIFDWSPVLPRFPLMLMCMVRKRDYSPFEHRLIVHEWFY